MPDLHGALKSILKLCIPSGFISCPTLIQAYLISSSPLTLFKVTSAGQFVVPVFLNVQIEENSCNVLVSKFFMSVLRTNLASNGTCFFSYFCVALIEFKI